MSAAQLIGFAINGSMFLLVLALGLETTEADILSLFRQPGLLLRSILSMNVVMLGFAIGVSLLFDPPPALKIAMVALAVSPVPPILPSKQLKAGGANAYTIGLLAAMALLAIVIVPATILLLGKAVGVDIRMPVDKVASIVMVSVIAPLIIGAGIRWLAPGFARMIVRRVSIAATVVLIVAALPVVVLAWPAVATLIGSGLVGLLVLFTVVGLAVGHWLGGPEPDNRTVLALATGARHPGVAIAIASVNFPDQRAVLAVVLYHLIFAAIISLPYVAWRTRRHAATQAKAAS